MLVSLSIKNYVLIDQLNIDFSAGLTTITGETGSGKSILLGALGLVLGERADAKALRDPDKKCVVEATFSVRKHQLQSLFMQFDLDFEDQSIIRREINSNGKSRAFINDTPVTLAQLKEVGIHLIDIHSQHQTLQVNSSEFQLQLIDAFAETGNEFQKYQEVYSDYRKSVKQLVHLEEQNRQAHHDLDYFQFQYNELKSADLDNVDLEVLEEDLQMLENAGEILQVLKSSAELLTNENSGIVANLLEVRNNMNKIAGFSKDFKVLAERLHSTFLELQDITSELESGNHTTDTDPEREQELRERLSALYNLQNKHAVRTVEGLIELRHQFEQKILNSENLENEILAEQKRKDQLYKELYALGESLAKKRAQAAVPLADQIHLILEQLNMSDARLKVQFSSLDAPSESGLNRISLLFQANKGSRFDELAKVASGGELSRLMLAIKSVLAKVGEMPTIIFDEIDTGVSGETAQKMAAILQKMSARMQVICITHLPQIAARGTTHMKVFKTSDDTKTETGLEVLTGQERTLEIAMMLSGANATEAAIANARDLLLAKG